MNQPPVRRRRLPAVQSLSAELLSQRVGNKTTAGDSIRFLRGNLTRLQSYAWLDDLVEDAYGDVPDPLARRFTWHLGKLRWVLLKALWAREIFVSPSVLDELLFYEIRRASGSDPITAVLERIRDARLTRPGLILFPLHSFGIGGAGLAHSFSSARISVIQPQWGLAVSPQTNSMEKTMQFLDSVRERFGIKESIPADLILHWRRSRGTRWLEQNPLLAVRTVQATGGYYENESIVLASVKAAGAVLAMLGVLQPQQPESAASLFSSSRVNNWQTLDIHHYVALYVRPGTHTDLTGDCVPIHERPAVTEIAELAIDLDSKYWSRRRQRQADEVQSAVQTVYRGYLQFAILGADDGRARTYRKLFESLSYLTRSLSPSNGQWREAVSLATAFEMLLTDRYESGVTARLQRRTRILLTGVPGTRKYQQAVGLLYDARSEIVHSGRRAGPDVDLNLARQAFAHTFIELAKRLPSLDRRSAAPLADLLGD